MMSSEPEWQYCDCESKEACACGRSHPAASSALIHWRESHWQLECAFGVLLEENDDMRQRIAKMAMDKIFQRRRNVFQE